ncbi:hypothetical protein BTVI_05328 [Pitangus sulphuratus]|nr:hypothetical protein BTVI_05328 [Pitangus sulphuratus]
MGLEQYKKKRGALIDPDTMYPNELQPVDASSHNTEKQSQASSARPINVDPYNGNYGEKDVENRPYMENCETYGGICTKGSFCGRINSDQGQSNESPIYFIGMYDPSNAQDCYGSNTPVMPYFFINNVLLHFDVSFKIACYDVLHLSYFLSSHNIASAVTSAL